MQIFYLISEHYELSFLSLPQSPSLPKALQLSWQVQLDESLIFLLTRFMYKINFRHLIHESKRRTKRHFTDSLPQRQRFHELSGLRLCSLVNGPKQPFWVFVKRHIHVVKMGQTGGDLRWDDGIGELLRAQGGALGWRKQWRLSHHITLKHELGNQIDLSWIKKKDILFK